VKGKKEPIRLFEVLGLKGKVGETELAYARHYEQAINLYFTRHFDEAISECDKLLIERPDASAVVHLKERCEIYRKMPPPEDWDGTWVMVKK
jgi:adenylate cyclase